MDHDGLLTAAAVNLAGWHESSVRALDAASSTGAWWWTAPTPAPWIYFTAIELRRPRSRPERHDALDELRHHLEDPAGSFEAICDTFGAHNFERVGLHRRSRGRWYARPTGAPPTDATADIIITEVRDPADLAAFERATCLAYGAHTPVTPFDIHDPAILDDPAMHVLVGRSRDGDGDTVVAGAMAYVTDAVVGVYGVGTVPGHRRRGYAHALTTTCLAVAPDRPATLQPSAAAASLYRRLGFLDVGPFSHWG